MTGEQMWVTFGHAAEYDLFLAGPAATEEVHGVETRGDACRFEVLVGVKIRETNRLGESLSKEYEALNRSPKDPWGRHVSATSAYAEARPRTASCTQRRLRRPAGVGAHAPLEPRGAVPLSLVGLVEGVKPQALVGSRVRFRGEALLALESDCPLHARPAKMALPVADERVVNACVWLCMWPRWVVVFGSLGGRSRPLLAPDGPV